MLLSSFATLISQTKFGSVSASDLLKVTQPALHSVGAALPDPVYSIRLPRPAPHLSTLHPISSPCFQACE